MATPTPRWGSTNFGEGIGNAVSSFIKGTGKVIATPFMATGGFIKGFAGPMKWPLIIAGGATALVGGAFYFGGFGRKSNPNDQMMDPLNAAEQEMAMRQQMLQQQMAMMQQGGGPTLMGEPLNTNGPLGNKVLAGRGMGPQNAAVNPATPEVAGQANQIG